METTQKELSVVKVQVTKAMTAAEQLAIKTKEDMPVAVELLSKIKQVGKVIKEKKEAITKPMNEALKNTRELFRPIEDSWAQAEQIVKGKMVEFSVAEDKRIKAEQEAIAKKVESGKMKFETGAKKIDALEKTEAVTISKSGAAEFRTVKKVVIEDIRLVPIEYFENEVVIEAVRLAVKNNALAGIKIPGVKVVEEKIVAGYSKATEEHAGKLSLKK